MNIRDEFQFNGKIVAKKLYVCLDQRVTQDS